LAGLFDVVAGTGVGAAVEGVAFTRYAMVSEKVARRRLLGEELSW